MLLGFQFLALAGMLVLLSTPEVTLQTSLLFLRDIAPSPWIFRPGLFTIADLWLLFSVVVVILNYSSKIRLPRGHYLAVVPVVVLYLAVGVFYNLFVFTSWKTYLYDVKSILYLFVPYLLLKSSSESRLRRIINERAILIGGVIAASLDTLYVQIIGIVEYPAFLGLPVYASVLSASLIFFYFWFSKGVARWLLALLLLVELVGLLNKLTLTTLYFAAVAPIYLAVYVLIRHRTLRVAAVMAAFITLHLVVPVAVIQSAAHLVSAKSDGVSTRLIQWQNFEANFWENIPGILGKGLGSTWFERFPVPEEDIYAVGTSLGETPEESMAQPVKFIYNITPAGVLHKWGIIGAFSLMYLFTSSMLKLQTRGIASRRQDFLVLATIVYGLENLTFVGILKSSMIVSIFAYLAERNQRALSLSARR